MGYFPNGTSGVDFQERYCFRCVNYRDLKDGRGEGCPIFDLHLLWNYDAVGDNADETKREGLEMFIPRDKDGWNKDCVMFIPKRTRKKKQKEKLF